MADVTPKPKRNIVIRVLAALLVCVALVLAGIHLPPVRSGILRAVLPLAERQTSLRIQVDRLDYNLFRLGVTAYGVRVAAAQSPDAPFFQAESIVVSLPFEILRGLFSLTQVDVRGGAVRIQRTATGSNLPQSSSVSTSEPGALPLRRIIAELSVEVDDQVAGLDVRIPRLRMDVAASGGQLDLAGSIGIRGQTVTVSRLSGGAAFDGRSFSFRDLNLASDVADARLDGTFLVMARTPSLNLQMAGSGNVARMTALATPTPVFDGQVAFEGTLTGPVAAIQADLRVRASRLTRDALALTDVDLTTRVTTGRADVSQGAFTLAGGRVEVTAGVAFDGTGSRVAGRWADVGLASLTRALVDGGLAVVPAGPSSGTVTAEGRGFDVTRWTTSAAVRIGAADNAAGQLAMPGQLRLDVNAGAWRMNGQHDIGGVAPVGFMLNGRLQPDGGASLAGSLDLASTSVRELADVLGRVGLADVPARLVAEGTLTASGTVSGSVAAPRVVGATDLIGVRGDGFDLPSARVTFDALPLDADVQLGAHADALQVAGQSMTAVDADARVINDAVVLTRFTATERGAPGQVRASGRYRFAGQAYDLQADVVNWRLAALSDLPVRGLANLSFSGAGTVDRPMGEARVTIADAFYQDLPLGALAAQAALDGVQASFTVEAASLGVSGRGTAGLAAPYTVAADVDAVNLDLSRFTPLVAASTVMLEGTASAALHVEGPLSRWRELDATLNLTSAEAMLGELAVLLEGPALVRYTAGTVSTPRLGVRAGRVQAEARGSLPLEDTPGSAAVATMSLIGDVGDMLAAVRSTRMIDVPALAGEGPVAVLARVEGSLAMPRVSADIDLGPASITTPGMPPLERVRVLGRIENGRADIQDLFAVVDGAEIMATGSAPLAWASSSTVSSPQAVESMARLSATLKNVTARLLSRLATGAAVPDIDGSLDATVELSSPTPQIASVSGEARIDRLEMSASGLAITQREPTRIVAEDGFARITSWEWTGEGTSLSVNGQVRLSNLQAGILANGELDLRLLSPFLRESGVSTAGRLSPRLSITGALTSPRLDGDMTLADTDIRLASPRVFVSGLGGRAIFSRDRLQIASLDGQINGGTLAIGGSVTFPQGGTPAAALTADIAGMALEYPEGLRTEIDGALRLSFVDGPEGADPVPLLSGSLHVVNGSYRQPITVVGGLLAALQSRAASAPPVAASGGSGPPITLDITLITDQDIVVDNNAATLALDADVRLIGTIAQPALSGRAEVREQGRVLLGRNTYQVVSGTLDFANPNRIDPELNFQLTTRAGGVPIDVMLTGTASAPMLALSSESSDLAESDLTSLLLTGRQLDELGSADAALVGSVLVGNLSGEVGQVLGAAGRVVGLDSIRLGGVDSTVMSDPSAVATATDPTSRLTFSKAIGSNLDVTFSQSLRDGEVQTWIVDYLPSRGLLARLVSNDDNLRTYEFRHDVQFGGGTRTRTRTVERRTVPRVVDIVINGALPDQNVRELIDLETGRAFDFQMLQDDRERVEAFYREQGYLAARVGARQDSRADGVAVVFTIQPGPQTRIETTGDPLPNGLQSDIAGVWADSIAGPLLIDEVRTLVATRLARDGYLRAVVDVRVSEMDGVQVLTVAVARGDRTTEVSVLLDGVSGDLADELNERLNAAGVVPQAPTDPQAVASVLRQALAGSGYTRAQVIVGTPTFEGASAVVRVQVQTGAPLTVGTVTVTGATLDAGRVRETLDLMEGMAFEQSRVDNALARLASLYRQEGYSSATATVATTPGPDASRVNVTFTVAEGPRHVVASVRVEGLMRVAESDALRAMTLRVGAPARVEDILRARTRLFATGLFRRVDVSTTTIDTDAPSSPNELPMRVVATVEEWPAVRLRYGFQAAEERPAEGSGRELIPGLSADATRRTLFGRAINIGGATVLQRRDRLGRVFVSTPTLFSLPLRSSLVVQKEREEFADDNVSDTTSISWEQRATVWGRLVVAYAYRFERVHSFVSGPPDPNFPPFDVSLNVARFTASGAWDSRSDPSTPVRGSLFTSSIENAPDALGSQIRFVRYFGQARHFQSWKGTVFASAFQFGTVTPLGDQEVIPSERFYTGGSTSIRGLAEDAAGERDFFGPTGGRVLVLFNQEARFPVYRWFQGVAFVDAGNVFKEPREVSVGKLTTSVGLGLRVATPFALLRVDYGHVVRGLPGGDQRARWIFGIGHAF